MIRALQLSDLARCALPGRLAGPDLVRTREALVAPAHRLSVLELARYSAAPTFGQHALVLVEGVRLRALAVARPRRGNRSWELAHLYAASGALVRCGEVLEQCNVSAAQQGAERMFLRLPQDSPLQVMARRSGFSPGFVEEVYQFREGADVASAVPHLRLRPPSSEDRYSLFRLYNACVPASVRSAFGLTFDQWLDSQENLPGRESELVWERDGQVRGWLRIGRHSTMLTVEAMLHPSEGTTASLLCEEVTQLIGRDHSLSWVVPGYQQALAKALRGAGCERRETCTVLVKPLAKAVKELSRSLVRA